MILLDLLYALLFVCFTFTREKEGLQRIVSCYQTMILKVNSVLI